MEVSAAQSLGRSIAMTRDDGAAFIRAIEYSFGVVQGDVRKKYGFFAMVAATNLACIACDRQCRPCKEQTPKAAILLMTEPFEARIVSEPYAKASGAIGHEVGQLRMGNLRRLKQRGGFDDVHAGE